MMMQRVYTDLLVFSIVFSVLFCIFCRLVNDLIGFWVFLELCGLSVIPSFFYFGGKRLRGFYGALLTYIVMSCLSSVFLMCGILFFDLYYFIFVGFVVKFGLFPFRLWVYRVFSESKWVFIFFLSVLLKYPILFFCYIFTNLSLFLVYVDCCLTMLMCSLFFWFFSCSWEYIWCHISLSSVSTLMVSCFCCSPDINFFIYFYYFVWASVSITYFYLVCDEKRFYKKFWYFCFLLLVTPISFPLFYKLSVCFAIFWSSFYVLLVWGVYSFSEQFFLYKLASKYFYSGLINSWVE